MLRVFRLLARCKGLRGTAFDPFGWTQERRQERRSIDDYVALMDRVCARLSPDRLALAIELARLPEGIRGYGHVKARNLVQAAGKQAELLARFEEAPSAGFDASVTHSSFIKERR
jgi:indolepyruvate ferredoxin oxidoreductase